MYCHSKSNYQDGIVEIPLTGLTPTQLYACPRTGPGFSKVIWRGIFYIQREGERWLSVLSILVELLRCFKLSFHNPHPFKSIYCVDLAVLLNYI